MVMLKYTVVEKLQSDLGFPKKQALESVESLLEIIKSTLESGEDLLVSGFGKFCVRDKHKRKGRNPETGEDMMISARRIVTFKLSGKLREKVNGG